MRARSFVAFVCAGALALSAASAASADAQTTPDSAKAEALFREASRLLAKKRYPEACAKFAESKRLEPGIGVTLYLGDCYEHVGRTASAWAEFSAAEDAARLAHDSRARVAHERAARLEARLSKVILLVAKGTAVDGLLVTQDGAAIGEAQWGVALPVDPGDHELDATAPDHRAWTQTIHVADGSATMTVDVPPLPLEAPRVTSAPPARSQAASISETPTRALPESSEGAPPQRVIGVVTVGVGLAAVGAGALFGLAAKSKLESSNANGLCNASDHCTADGLAARSDGLRDATLSTIAFSVGAGALVGGALLYLTAPHARPGGSSPVDVSGMVGPGGGRLAATVHF